MITSRTIVISVILMLLVYVPVTAEIYKWVDEKGKTHFSDHPPQDTSSSGEVKVIPTYNITPQSSPDYRRESGNPGSRSYDETPSSDEVQSQKQHKVELYVTSWCPYCKKARNFFLSRGIPFSEYDIEKDRNAARRKKRLDSRKGVPFAVINGHKVHGFIAAAYERALHEGQ
jgi:glutaredoxin